MVKILIVLSYLLMEGFDAFVDHLNDTYIDRELPENVQDIMMKRNTRNGGIIRMKAGISI